MTTTAPSTTVVRAETTFSDAERIALAGFLAGYRGLTRDAYALDLRSGQASRYQQAGRAPHPQARLHYRRARRRRAPPRRPGSRQPRRPPHHHALRPACVSLDRHATYIVAAFIAGAAR